MMKFNGLLTYNYSQKRGILLLIILIIGISAFRSPRIHDLYGYPRPLIIEVPAILRIDINVADSAEWEALPGIGRVLSSRIVKYRDARGGFLREDDLLRIYRMDTQRFIRLLPYVCMSPETTPTEVVERRRYDPKRMDVNVVGAEELKALRGIGEVLSERICRYREAIGGFDSVGQVRKVYGLREETFGHIARYLFVAEGTLEGFRRRVEEGKRVEGEGRRSLGDGADGRGVEGRKKEGKWKKKGKDVGVLDLNRADSAALVRVPGIGAKLSARIVRCREAMGYYYAVEQLREVYGLSEENYERMKPYLKVGAYEAPPKRILNQSLVRELAGFVFVDWKEDKAIVRERKRLGAFNNWDEVARLEEVDDLMLKQLQVYFVLD